MGPIGTGNPKFQPTAEAQARNARGAAQPQLWIQAIAAMPAYAVKSDTELRLEDYLRRKGANVHAAGAYFGGAAAPAAPGGAPNPFGAPAAPGAAPNPFAPAAPAAGANPFAPAAPAANPFAPAAAAPNPFAPAAPAANPFSPQQAANPFAAAAPGEFD